MLCFTKECEPKPFVVGSVLVELGNVNKKLMNFLLPALFNTNKSADGKKFRLKTSQ